MPNNASVLKIDVQEKSSNPYESNPKPRPLRISTSPRSILSEINPINSPVVNTQSRNKWLKIQIVLTIITISILAFVFWRRLYTVLQIFLRFIAREPIPGSLIVFAIFVVFPIFCIPISPLIAVSCGFIYYQEFGEIGLVIVCVNTWVGTSIAAFISFLCARYLLSDCIQKLSQKNTKFMIIQKLSQRNGFKVVAVFRLNLILPFFAVNYILGTTPISAKSFLQGNVTLLPRSIVYPLLGSTISRLSDAVSKSQSSMTHPAALAAMIIGVIITGISFLLFGYAAKREYRKMLAMAEEMPSIEEEKEEKEAVEFVFE